MGVHLKRYQAVVLDSVLAGALTMWAVFGSTFALYMKEFVAVIIVWISPWFGIFVADWLMRRFRYNPGELQRNDRGSLYYGAGGVNWNAAAAFLIGVVAATTAFSKPVPPANFPFHWMTPIANHWGAFYCDGKAASNCGGVAGWFGGADFSIFIGILVPAVAYYLLDAASGLVRRQVARQRELEPDRYR
jgi:purine-cytosine permease-like protein